MSRNQFLKEGEGIMDVIVARGESFSAHVEFPPKIRFSHILVISCPMNCMANFLPLKTSNMP